MDQIQISILNFSFLSTSNMAKRILPSSFLTQPPNQGAQWKTKKLTSEQARSQLRCRKTQTRLDGRKKRFPVRCSRCRSQETRQRIPVLDRLSFSSGGTGHVKELNFFAADPNFSGVLV